jgi:hypothetical protein
LTEEPQGRHARPTQTGSALRRFFRSIGTPEPGAAPTPASAAPNPAALPSTAPTPVSEPATVPASAPPAVSAPALVSAPAPVPPPQSTVDFEPPLLGPAPPASVRWQDHEVTWSPVPGADSYSVQICREPSFAEPLLYTVPGVSFTVPRLPGPVYVRVRCVSGADPGRWGDVHDLSAQPPAATGAP